MDSITRRAPRAKAIDLVATIRAAMDQTTDPAKRDFLLMLGNDILRRRQMLPTGNKPRRRAR